MSNKENRFSKQFKEKQKYIAYCDSHLNEEFRFIIKPF